jgi:hypothetical protein
MYTTVDHLKAMRFDRPSAIPVAIGTLPGAWMMHREALTDLARAYPHFFGEGAGQSRNYDELGYNFQVGDYTDHWGCVVSNAHEGIVGLVTGHPVPNREDVWTLQPPNTTQDMKHGFFFLRLFDLRGFEEMMVDFAEEPAELQQLIDIVHGHNVKELEARMAWYKDQIMYFGDDLGMQTSLPIPPATWRKYLKPCYMDLYTRARARGFNVYMHTDGHILPIIPDLIECGVEIVNPQVRANGLEGLRAVAKGKVCVDLDLDRQMFPFATPAELDAHVRECVKAMGSREGGLWLRVEIGDDVPIENVVALAEACERYRGHWA